MLMRALRFALALILAGCAGSSISLSSPTPSASLNGDQLSPAPDPRPLMQGLPTAYAACAGNAKTLSSATTSCIAQWEPQGGVAIDAIFHFHPLVPKASRTRIREAISSASKSIVGLLPIGISKMTVHVVLAQNRSREFCDEVAKKYLSGTGNDWIWQRGAPDDAGFLDQWISDGCGRVDDGMIATTTFPELTSAWLFTDWTDSSKSSGAEGWISRVFIGSIHAQAAKQYAAQRAKADSFYLLPMYLVPYLEIANAMYWEYRSKGSSILKKIITSTSPKTSYHNKGGWVATFSDDRFCPQKGIDFSNSCWSVGREWSGDELYREYPDVYFFNTVAFKYITAYLGMDWMRDQFWPTLLDQYKQNQVSFDDAYDQVAQQLWGGTWSELETALDQQLREELERAGY